MAAGSIVIDLLMKTGAFETDTKRAEKALRDFQKTAKNWATVIATATAAAGAAVSLFGKKAIDELDALDEFAQQTGIAVEKLSSLANAAKIEGMSLEEFGGSISKLSRTMAEAASGSEQAAAAFKAMGLDPKQFTDTESALLSISEKLAGYRDGFEKTALVQELFGKSGARLIPFLNQGADGINKIRSELSLYNTDSSAAAARAGEFNDQITKFNIIISNLFRTLASQALPALKDLAQAFFDTFIRSDELNAELRKTTGMNVENWADKSEIGRAHV